MFHKAEMAYEPWYKFVFWQTFLTQTWIQGEIEYFWVRYSESLSIEDQSEGNNKDYQSSVSESSFMRDCVSETQILA